MNLKRRPLNKDNRPKEGKPREPRAQGQTGQQSQGQRQQQGQQPHRQGQLPPQGQQRHQGQRQGQRQQQGAAQTEGFSQATGGMSGQSDPRRRRRDRGEQQQSQQPQQSQRTQPGQQRQGQRPQGQRQGQQQRQQPRRAPPPPPAYIQRDLLLVVNAEDAQGINQVREKLDPLAKKVPAHVTLIFPEPATNLSREFLKAVATQDLPVLESLTFNEVSLQGDKYLWLKPDSESVEKLKMWRTLLVKYLSKHSQDENYFPHITLGYVPRSMTPDDAVTFARNHISLPVTLKFERLLLEEFSEDQVSRSVDTQSVSDLSWGLNNQAPVVVAVAEETVEGRSDGSSDSDADIGTDPGSLATHSSQDE